MRILLILIFSLYVLTLTPQTCTTRVKYDFIESYDWVGLWFGSVPTEGYPTNAFVSSTSSAALYGTGGGASAIEQDWYILPNVTGLNTSYTYQFRFRLGSYTFTNPTATARGVDGSDLVEVQISTNGEISYTSEIRITGNNNATWDYNTNGIISKTANGSLSTYGPAVGGNRTSTGDGYSVITLAFTGISQLAVDILCRVNANGEEWWLDNMELYEIAPCVTTPVELINFSVSPFEKYNELTWTTATELNNSHFEIERSQDAFNWVQIAKIEGKGNSFREINYCYRDLHFIQDSLNYYRLAQIDYNGEFKYFGIISVANVKNKKLIMIISIDGRTVTPDYRGIIIELYDDGSHEKKIQY